MKTQKNFHEEVTPLTYPFLAKEAMEEMGRPIPFEGFDNNEPSRLPVRPRNPGTCGVVEYHVHNHDGHSTGTKSKWLHAYNGSHGWRGRK